MVCNGTYRTFRAASMAARTSAIALTLASRRLRAIYKQSWNLFSAEAARTIVLGVVASFIYERTRSVDHPIKVEILTNELVIENAKDRIIVPLQRLRCNPERLFGVGARDRDWKGPTSLYHECHPQQQGREQCGQQAIETVGAEPGHIEHAQRVRQHGQHCEGPK